MEPQIAKAWTEHEHEVEQWIRENCTDWDMSYAKLLENTLRIIDSGVDHERITVADHGDYQGTMVFILSESYRSVSSLSEYLYTYVDYGSCSGCDTLECAKMNDDIEERIKDYKTLCLHMIQRIKRLAE